LPPYASLDLAAHVGDDPAAVAENRARLARRAGLPDPATWWFLDQVHGATVVTVEAPPDPGASVPAADAAVTAAPGLALVVLTADCAPVAIADDDAVGVVHVGWRGLAGDVVAGAVDALRAVGRGEVRAAIGPCIRPAHYEFGRAELDRLIARFGPGVEARTADGRPALDVAAGVRMAFAECGVSAVDDTGDCTAAEPDRFFSFRRDGRTGRQAVVVVKP